MSVILLKCEGHIAFMFSLKSPPLCFHLYIFFFCKKLTMNLKISWHSLWFNSNALEFFSLLYWHLISRFQTYFKYSDEIAGTYLKYRKMLNAKSLSSTDSTVMLIYRLALYLHIWSFKMFETILLLSHCTDIVNFVFQSSLLFCLEA